MDYKKEIENLVVEYGLCYTNNPGGGQFVGGGIDMHNFSCQVSGMDYAEDYWELMSYIRGWNDGRK